MSMTSNFAYLKDIKPFKSGWRIQVKVLHTWKQFNAHYGESFEVILADESGNKIHATCKKAFLQRLERTLTVGEWKIIENFSLSQASGLYRSTSHVYKMSFVNNTSITKSSLRSSNMFLSLVDFETILSGKLNTAFLIDVIGQVIDVGEIQNVLCGGKERKKLEFTLRDINDQRIACCLWGKFGEMVYSKCEETNVGVVVCLIRFAKIGKYREMVQISNSFDASLLLINPEIKEAKELKQVFEKKCNALTVFENKEEKLALQMKQEKWDQYPDRTIAELLTSSMVDKCKVLCTVYAIDVDWGWYYFGHVRCNKKVTKVIENPLEPKRHELSVPLWDCEECDDKITDVTGRYKLHIIVKDNSGVAKFMLLDTAAKSLVGHSAPKLLNGSLDEMEDTDSFPDEIMQVVGKTFRFGICIEKDNVAYGGETYKAMKVWSANQLVQADSILETGSESTNGNTIITYEEESYDTDSQENSDAVKTPSSKRSNEENEQTPDLNSTSKKQCIKIKVEKITQEEMKSMKK